MRADRPPWRRKSGSSSHQPQTNGKLERFHETRTARLNLLVYMSPEALRAAQKSRPLARRVRYNRAATMQGTRDELTGDLLDPRGLTESQGC